MQALIRALLQIIVVLPLLHTALGGTKVLLLQPRVALQAVVELLVLPRLLLQALLQTALEVMGVLARARSMEVLIQVLAPPSHTHSKVWWQQCSSWRLH